MRSALPFVFALLISASACRREPLPVYWGVPEFKLTAQSGQVFDSKSLDGKIWVADFIFTTCTGPCPRMSSQMRAVQSSIASLPDVRLVSFTVDPSHDTPQVLQKYAARYHAQPDRWLFLTGDQRDLQSICREGFKLGDVDGSLVHSTRFVLMDRKGRVRGLYGTSEDDAVQRLIRDIRTLEGEKS